MWKSQTGVTQQEDLKKKIAAEIAKEKYDDDDWETDPEPANMISEKASRYGNKETASEARKVQVDMDELRKQVVHNNSSVSKDQFLQREGVNVKTSYGVKKE